MDNRWGLPRPDGSYAVWGLPYPVPASRDEQLAPDQPDPNSADDMGRAARIAEEG